MKNTALVLATFGLAGAAFAQQPAGDDDLFGKFSDIPIDIAAERMGASGQLSTASGNVQITYGSTTIYSDEAQYDPNSRDVIVTGNVRIYREGQLVTAERAVYNLETKDIIAASSRGESLPFKFSGTSFQNIPGGTGYLVKEGIFTTSDSANPDWSMRAKRARIYPKDHVVFQDMKFYIGNTPVFWFPYLYQSLNKANAFTITPGYSSAWGAYMLTNYTFPISDTMGGTLRLDLRSTRGAAVGFDTNWEEGESKQSWGRFSSYLLDDAAPGTNQTSLAREAIDSTRYRVSFQARQYITDDIYATVNINKLSDTRILQDFYPGDFRENPQPDNSIAVAKLGDDYELTFLIRSQLNDFFDGTDRLPELALDITRQPLFGSKIFYEGETSVGHYNRNFASGSTSQDYNATRVDTFHHFLLPRTIDGWLSVVPRVGVRGTWYSQSGAVLPFEEDSTVKLADGTTQVVKRVTDRLVKEGSLFRPVFNAGFEMSFKASRAFEQVQNRTLGLDGLRHVMQPYLDFSFVRSGVDSQDILKFDRIERSTQPPPISFPAFNAIDSIQDWNILRLGIRNRLQTRRDNSTINWLEMDTYFDVRFDRPDFGIEPDLGTFSNIVNHIRWTPLSWVSLTLDSQFPLLDQGFTEVNSRAVFFVNDKVQFNIGHRYLDGNVLFQNSSLMDFGGYFRLNDKWGFSFRETYEFRDSLLENQRYELHRDLSSWIASLGVVATNNSSGGKNVNEYGVILTFTLKDLPDIKLPISLDPSSLGGGTGKNR